jgi:hypothetical protein
MTNAKQELQEELEGKAKVKCASITYGCNEYKGSKKVLKLNYTNDEYSEFLNSLDFEYDRGYGSQEIYGIVWLEDGTWLSRGEYDGSEWWDYNVLPNIPDDCK